MFLIHSYTHIYISSSTDSILQEFASPNRSTLVIEFLMSSFEKTINMSFFSFFMASQDSQGIPHQQLYNNIPSILEKEEMEKVHLQWIK